MGEGYPQILSNRSYQLVTQNILMNLFPVPAIAKHTIL